MDDRVRQRHRRVPHVPAVARETIVAVVVAVRAVHRVRPVMPRIRIDGRRDRQHLHNGTRLEVEAHGAVHLRRLGRPAVADRIEVGEGRHRVNGTGGRIHHDRPTGPRPILAQAPLEGQLRLELDVRLDRQVDVGARRRVVRDDALVVELAPLGVLHALDDARHARQLAVEPLFDAAGTYACGIDGAEDVRHGPPLEVLADLLVVNRDTRDQLSVHQNGMRLRIGRHGQELIAVPSVFRHRAHLRIVEVERVGDRLHDRRLRAPRLALPLHHGIRQMHGIEPILPERDRLDERGVFPVCAVDRPPTGRNFIFEIVIRRGNPGIQMRTDELLPGISGQQDQRRDRRPETPPLATPRHRVSAPSCTGPPCRRCAGAGC